MMKKNADNNKNVIYITLKNERSYYQGDVISGTVFLDLHTAAKTQSVKLVLEGIAKINDKPNTIYTTTQMLMEPPAGEKFVTLEAHSHSYPFHINAPSSKALPSTLDIPELLSIQYRLVAIQTVQFGLWDFPKVHPTTEKEVHILERIDVNEFPMNYNEIREVALMGLDGKVRVTADLLRTAAVKGATIPISVTIEHVGVMVKDKAIKVKLLRNVYYRNTKLNTLEPEVVSNTNGNIMIIGPTKFTATTKLKLTIPYKICPTVEETGKTFKVEYLMNIVVNLNEESPHIKEREEEIVIFDVPFTIGTYPQLEYSIDDDEEEEEEEEEYAGAYNNSSYLGDKISMNNNNNDSNNNNNDHTADFSNDEVKVLDQVNLNSSGSVLPQMIEEQYQQKEQMPLEDYKPDEKPEPVIQPKRRTMTYESGVQLPEFIETESEPTLPEQIIENKSEKNKVIPQNDIENNKKDVALPQEQKEDAVSKEDGKDSELSLPEQLPAQYHNNQKEKEQPVVMNAHSSSSSSKNATFLPTPISESRPSSPSPPYQGSPVVANNNTNNTSLPVHTTTTTSAATMSYAKASNTGINITEDPYQLPTELSPSLEKRTSYLSMNNLPETPSLPVQIDPTTDNRRPYLPPRNQSPFPQYNTGSESLTTSSNFNNHTINTPPIPPRLNDNVSPVFNGPPPLPSRTQTVSPSNSGGYGYPPPPPPPPPSNNGGYGHPSPPPPPHPTTTTQYAYDNNMPRPYPHSNNFYNNYHHGSSSSLYSTSTSPPPPPVALPMYMPSPIHSHSQPTSNYPPRPSSTVPTSYPEPSYNMPTPQYPQQQQQQHYYH